jgi:hypothetical protein
MESSNCLAFLLNPFLLIHLTPEALYRSSFHRVIDFRKKVSYLNIRVCMVDYIEDVIALLFCKTSRSTSAWFRSIIVSRGLPLNCSSNC